MLFRAVFNNVEYSDKYVYNVYKNNRTEIGLLEIENINTNNLEKVLVGVPSSRLIIADIPDETAAVYLMMKDKHVINDELKREFEMRTNYLEKEWIVYDTTLDEDTYGFLFLDKNGSAVLDRYFYTREYARYLDTVSKNIYTDVTPYNMLDKLSDIIETNDFERDIHNRLAKIICAYIRYTYQNYADKDIEKWFDEDDLISTDYMMDKLCSKGMVADYLSDIIKNHELNILIKDIEHVNS